MSERRMQAYYYGFDHTGQDLVDKVLSAVACAGKAYHHTEDWHDSAVPWDGHTGDSPADWIQNAAQEAADLIEALKAENERLRARLEIDRKWQVRSENGELVRVELTHEEGDKMPDGIACRDATIKLMADEIADLKSSVVAFCGPWSVEWAKMHGLPPGHICDTHYDILQRAGARLVDFVRVDFSGGDATKGGASE